MYLLAYVLNCVMQCYETVVSFLYFGVCDSDAPVNDADDDNMQHCHSC